MNVCFDPNACFRPSAQKLRRFEVGPIGPHLQRFAALVSQQGYCSVAGWVKVRFVADFSRWLGRRRIPLKELNERHVTAFLRDRWKSLGRRWGERKTMALLLRHLRQANLVATSPEVSPDGLIAPGTADFEKFLLGERSLAPCTAGRYVRIVRRFLSQCFPDGKIHLKRLRTQDVTDFIVHDAPTHAGSTVQATASALRIFLRFLFQKGRILTNLAAAVPAVPRRRPKLPWYLEAQEVEKVLESCDRRRKMGRRDYAILLLLARLGLRAGEVAHLTLDEIDWRAGELLIRGKGARVDRLPLPHEVGQALADYLQKGRPACSSRCLFIKCKAPLEGFTRRGSVGCVVRAALRRAHLNPPHKGAHILRHSLATGMLRNGASLGEIGQVLRHQQPQTTEIYAKVDFNALRTLALPWPGGAL
jgi:site-specific recombinase XerD